MEFFEEFLDFGKTSFFSGVLFSSSFSWKCLEGMSFKGTEFFTVWS